MLHPAASPRRRSYLADDDNQVGGCQVLLLVSDQDAGGSAQEPSYTVLEDVLAHMGIHSRQGVVQKVHISRLVAGACQGHPVPLPTAQVDALQCKLASEQPAWSLMQVTPTAERATATGHA